MVEFDKIKREMLLDKTLKGIQVVCKTITERIFCLPGPRKKYFERFFWVIKLIRLNITKKSENLNVIKLGKLN